MQVFSASFSRNPQAGSSQQPFAQKDLAGWKLKARKNFSEKKRSSTWAERCLCEGYGTRLSKGFEELSGSHLQFPSL